MTMLGTAFLPIWHDIDAAMEEQYLKWHTAEHIPERVLTPGIVVGRRYEDPEAQAQRYFLLYEAQSFDVFASEGYFATANARSEWTKRIDPYFQNFRRAPCHLVMTRGRGIGGALATFRISFAPLAPSEDPQAPTAKDLFNLAIRAWVESTAARELVTSVHVGVTAPVARRPLSSTSLSLRPDATGFDAVLLVEGISRPVLKQALPALEDELRSRVPCLGSSETGVYSLSYLLSAAEVQ